jgi:biotin transport system substrate-specific component
MGMIRAAPATAGDYRGAVLADTLPGARLRDAVLVVGYVVAIAIGAKIAVHLPSTPVPVTGQTLAVLLGAIVLGPWRAVVGGVLYAGGGLAGLPLLAAASTASLGYVFGFVLAAGIVGYLAERGWDRTTARLLALLVLGNVAIYVLGAGYLALYLDVGPRQAFVLGVQPFLLGDAVKLALALAMVPSAWKLVGGVR